MTTHFYMSDNESVKQNAYDKRNLPDGSFLSLINIFIILKMNYSKMLNYPRELVYIYRLVYFLLLVSSNSFEKQQQLILMFVADNRLYLFCAYSNQL